MNDRKRYGEKEKEEMTVRLGRTDGVGARESRKERVCTRAQPRLRSFLGAVESETRGN